MSSIFKLKTDPIQLQSANQGCSDLQFSEYLPTRDVTNDGFPTARFVIPFEMSPEKHWIPSRSYLRIRCELTRGDGSQLVTNDNVAPNYNLAANLFQSLEFQLDGKTISRCADNVAEVDTLEQRLSKSKAWMESVGASVNWLQESVNDRINDVSSDGNRTLETKVTRTLWDAKNAAGGTLFQPVNAFEAVATNPTITAINAPDSANGNDGVADTAAMVAELIALGFVKGAKFQFGGVVYTLLSNPYNGGSNQCRFYLDKNFPTDGVAAADLKAGTEANGFALVSQTNVYTDAPRSITGFEIIWRPLCLSIFKYAGALPTGKYSLICTPHNASGNNYKIRAVEVPMGTATPTFGTGGGDVRFNVSDVRLYICNVTGDRVEDVRYFIDLEETRCQKSLLKTTNNLTKTYFDVSPSVYGMTLAFQGEKAGAESQYSASSFTVYNADQSELKLNRLFISYGNRSFPRPDADPSYKLGKPDDYTTKMYVDTLINSGAYFSEGGGETIGEWQRRGAIYFYQIPKDAQDRSTRATVNCQFGGTPFDNAANILLFDHARRAVQVTIQKGVVTSVEDFEE